MKEKITPYLKKLADEKAIQLQYWKDKTENDLQFNDPLMEEQHEVVRGLVHKYPNRALLKISYQCAAHCRFCTRIRQIGDKSGNLNTEDIAAIVQYLNEHPEIDDVILSGGDPLYTPQITEAVLQAIRNISSVKVIRIGSRLPFHSPDSFKTPPLKRLLTLIDDIGKEKPFYLLLHIEHPAELTEESENVVRELRQLKLTLLSQSVFLKGINDDVDVLYELFKRIYHLGVIPYYIYHCDRVKGLERFYGDIEKEKEIAKELRQRLSGIACPLFVEDIENGYGKIPVM